MEWPHGAGTGGEGAELLMITLHRYAIGVLSNRIVTCYVHKGWR